MLCGRLYTEGLNVDNEIGRFVKIIAPLILSPLESEVKQTNNRDLKTGPSS